jgi:hypothetical protein
MNRPARFATWTLACTLGIAGLVRAQQPMPREVLPMPGAPVTSTVVPPTAAYPPTAYPPATYPQGTTIVLPPGAQIYYPNAPATNVHPEAGCADCDRKHGKHAHTTVGQAIHHFNRPIPRPHEACQAPNPFGTSNFRSEFLWLWGSSERFFANGADKNTRRWGLFGFSGCPGQNHLETPASVDHP